MSKKKTANAELAELVADKVAEQVRQLTLKHWHSIEKTMGADENSEIKLTFGSTLTNRAAEEGTVAKRDSRILTVLSFSLGKESDKSESPYPDPSQPDLPNA